MTLEELEVEVANLKKDIARFSPYVSVIEELKRTCIAIVHAAKHYGDKLGYRILPKGLYFGIKFE